MCGKEPELQEKDKKEKKKDRLITKENEEPFIEVSHLKERLMKSVEEDSNEAAEQVESILSDLNKLGVIIYFNEGTLKEKIISNPLWFNLFFKSILDFGRKKIAFIIEKIQKEVEEMERMREFQNNHLSNNSKQQINSVIKELKGSANHKLSILEIWGNETERNLSNIYKFSFRNLSDRLEEIQQKLIEEGNEKAMLSYKIYNHLQVDHDLCQIYMNTQELNILKKEILGSPKHNQTQEERRTYNEKINFLEKILIKFDLIFPKQRVVQEDTKPNYLVPFLFPKNKPKMIFLKGRIKKEDISRNHEWVINYHFDFKPSTMWV